MTEPITGPVDGSGALPADVQEVVDLIANGNYNLPEDAKAVLKKHARVKDDPPYQCGDIIRVSGNNSLWLRDEEVDGYPYVLILGPYLDTVKAAKLKDFSAFADDIPYDDRLMASKHMSETEMAKVESTLLVRDMQAVCTVPIFLTGNDLLTKLIERINITDPVLGAKLAPLTGQFGDIVMAEPDSQPKLRKLAADDAQPVGGLSLVEPTAT